ncbi:MAG: sugar ABC transporter permease [Propionibacteriaceae bacterium]|nr:sugar ABC transporter permease [Propionibacteriaceae bacterium]
MLNQHDESSRTAQRGARRSAQAAQGYGLATPYLLLLPAIVVYACFMLFPLGRAVQLSLYDWNGLTVGVWAGFDNYLRLATDGELRAAFGHALVLIVFYCVIPIVLGLIIAAILNRAKVKGLGFFRTIYFLPQVIALVVAATAWRSIWGLDGSLNAVLKAIGLGGLAQDWLGSYTLALPAVGVIGTWLEIGLVMVLLLAGMGRIPHELYEAARLDGAGAVREFFSVTLPSVRGEIAVAATLTIVAALKNFDLVYMTTHGGPGGTTSVPSYEVYNQAFMVKQVGLASAIGVTLTLLIFIINLIVNRVADKVTS